VNLFLSQTNYVDTLKSSGQQYETLKTILEFLKTKKPTSFEECIKWARLQFEEDYSNSLKQLLFNLPRDQVSWRWHLAGIRAHSSLLQVTSTGQPFWSGPKRAPEPLEFSAENVSPTSLQFI
jgi:ubiquitin-activating enzyme E1